MAGLHDRSECDQEHSEDGNEAIANDDLTSGPVDGEQEWDHVHSENAVVGSVHDDEYEAEDLMYPHGTQLGSDTTVNAVAAGAAVLCRMRGRCTRM